MAAAENGADRPNPLRSRFSEFYEVDRTGEDDWFDVLMPFDTGLFVDPFLIYLEERSGALDLSSVWAGAHARLLDFFNFGLELVARSRFNRGSQHSAAAERLFLFPEPPEFCLGFGETPMGLGSGRGLGAAMLNAAETTIRLGLESVEHFEELTLFQEQVAEDRIGDIVCNVLKREFITYTQEVAERHGIEMKRLPVRHAAWSREAAGWSDEPVWLPENPFWRGTGILLTPARFLRKLPNIWSEDFWNWAFTYASEDIRGQFNYDVARGMKAREIVRLAQMNPELVRRYVRDVEENPRPAYPLEEDPNGKVNWYDAASELAAALTLPAPPRGPTDFCLFIEQLINEFIQIVEARGGWSLLWVRDKPRDEKHVQMLFNVSMIGFCKSNNIDFTPEANAGSGPVDFKFSQGWELRAIVEVKLANNSRYWKSIERQTPQYMRAEDVECGFFVTIQFRTPDLSVERTKRVQDLAKKISKDRKFRMKPLFVNALPKPSASKL